MSEMSVGVIGLGSMGTGIASNLVKAGLSVKGFDIFGNARDAFAAAGGAVAASAAEAARDVDLLLLMVVDAAQVEDVLFGEPAAAEQARAGTVVMICPTIAPADVRRLAARIEAAGLLPLDAPVSGGKVGADAGSLTVMASGCDAAFDAAEPVLNAMSGTLYRVGDTPGLGATYKIVHQLAAGVHLAVAAEVMAFGAQAGCDPETLFGILANSAGRSWMMTDRVPHILEDDYAPRSTVDIFVKDLGLVIETGCECKTPLPLAAAAHQLFLAASSMGHGRIDDAGVVKVYEVMTGARVHAAGGK